MLDRSGVRCSRCGKPMLLETHDGRCVTCRRETGKEPLVREFEKNLPTDVEVDNGC